MTFKIIERLAATPAAPQRLAGGRAKFGQYFSIPRAALRASHLLLTKKCAAPRSRLRRRDAVFPELLPALLAHPVGGPGRRQHGAHPGIAKTRALQRQFDLQ